MTHVLPILTSLALLPAASTPAGQGPPPNVLVVVLDDIGRDDVGCYQLGADLALTPEIDAVAAQGILFTR